MPQEMRIGNAAPRDIEIGVNFPFTVVLEHAAQDLSGMFAVTRAFDLYEMEKDLSGSDGLVKENILVDVLECTPTTTTVKVTPVETLAYGLLAKHTELMIKTVAKKLLGGKAKVIKLTWELDKTGVSSDLRSMLRKVN